MEKNRFPFKLSIGEKYASIYDLFSSSPSRLARCKINNFLLDFVLNLNGVKENNSIYFSEDAGRRVIIFMRVVPFLRSQGSRAKLCRLLRKLESDHVNYWFYWMKMRGSWLRAVSSFIRLFGLRKRDL